MRVISILGEGCFGQVWKCEALNIAGKSVPRHGSSTFAYPCNHLMKRLITRPFSDNEGTSSVAVKTLKETAGDKERQELLKELQVMKTLKPHPNIVTLLGCCTDKGKTRHCSGKSYKANYQAWSHIETDTVRVLLKID